MQTLAAAAAAAALAGAARLARSAALGRAAGRAALVGRAGCARRTALSGLDRVVVVRHARGEESSSEQRCARCERDQGERTLHLNLQNEMDRGRSKQDGPLPQNVIAA